MLDPATAAVARALLVHGEALLGAGLGMLLCGVYIGMVWTSAEARAAAVSLGVVGALQVVVGGTLQWYAPALRGVEAPAPSAQSIAASRALFERVGTGALMLAAVAIVAVAVLALGRRSRPPVRRGMAFGVGFGAVAIAVQALAAEGTIRAGLRHLDHERAFLDVEARVVKYFAQHSPLRFRGITENDLSPAVLPSGPDELGVERVRLRLESRSDAYPEDCLASPTEVWCLFSGRRAALAKLVKGYDFTRVAAGMTDDQVVDWVAFTLGVSVWRPATAPQYTRGHGAVAPRVDRGMDRIRVEFWELHAWTPGFAVQLRHTVVKLRGGGVTVRHGLMTRPLTPAWDHPGR